MKKYMHGGETVRQWRKGSKFVTADDALEEDFSLRSVLIKARIDAGMTQSQVAAAMGTTQSAIARLENGRLKPTMRTLQHYAKATHTRLRVSFKPDKASH